MLIDSYQIVAECDAESCEKVLTVTGSTRNICLVDLERSGWIPYPGAGLVFCCEECRQTSEHLMPQKRNVVPPKKRRKRGRPCKSNG